MGPGFPLPRFLRRAGRCFGALVLGCVITQFSQAATADELTDALIRYAMHDYPRAIEMLTPLANRGDAVAQTKLGLIYTRGEGVARDDVAALGWLTRAAEQDQSEAQFELGVMYRDGLGTPANGALAMHWFERATERGVPHAFNAIGEMYLGHRTSRRTMRRRFPGSFAAPNWTMPNRFTTSASATRLVRASSGTKPKPTSGSTLQPMRA